MASFTISSFRNQEANSKLLKANKAWIQLQKNLISKYLVSKFISKRQQILKDKAKSTLKIVKVQFTQISSDHAIRIVLQQKKRKNIEWKPQWYQN